MSEKLPAAEGDMEVVAISDIHGDIRSIVRVGPVLSAAHGVLILGDLTQYGRAWDAAKVLEAVRGFNGRVWAVPGNLDHPDVGPYLTDEGVGIHAHGTALGELGLAGVGGSNPTPFHTPYELSEGDLYFLFSQAAREVAAFQVKVFVSHAPPKDTLVDRVSSGMHVGSLSVRRVVEEFRPNVLLCGHIHEAAGVDRIGDTEVINPGPLADGRYVRLVYGRQGLKTEIMSWTGTSRLDKARKKMVEMGL